MRFTFVNGYDITPKKLWDRRDEHLIAETKSIEYFNSLTPAQQETLSNIIRNELAELIEANWRGTEDYIHNNEDRTMTNTDLFLHLSLDEIDSLVSLNPLRVPEDPNMMCGALMRMYERSDVLVPASVTPQMGRIEVHLRFILPKW